MKPMFVLMLAPLLVIGGLSTGFAADRDAVDRDTRQESDALRADMRQHRLKKVKALDDLVQPQAPSPQPNPGKAGSKPGE